MKRPCIGVLPLYEEAERLLTSEAAQQAWRRRGHHYWESVEAAGGLPVLLPMTVDEGKLREMVRQCDGFLFTGGEDVDPARYGEAVRYETVETCPPRDEMEFPLFALALESRKPIFGICRGCQLINAALGGTLWQDLPGEHGGDIAHSMQPPCARPAHEVRVVPGTPLAALWEGELLPVNSLHHQAVRTLAPGLEQMAAAPDGVTEAFWMPSHPFLWAVQWHPEYAYAPESVSRALFSAFVAAAARQIPRR